MVDAQPGDYVCVPISGQVGKLIRFGEWLNGDGFSNYEHVEIYVGQPDRQGPYGYTMGAYPGGARLVPLPAAPDDLPGSLWSSGHFSLTSSQRSSIVTTALACKDIPYSSLDYFALAAHRLHIPVPLLQDYIASTKHLICSQLVDLCYHNAGVDLFNNRWAGYVTPADLANLILKLWPGRVCPSWM